MSAVVASLVVNLSVHTGAFDDGLKKAGVQVKDFQRNVSRAVIPISEKMFSAGAGGTGGMQQHLRGLDHLLTKIGSRTMGGGTFGMLSAGGEVLGGLAGISTGMVGVGAALVGAGYLANRFGKEIRTAREEAAKLGIEFKSGLSAGAEIGLIRFSENVDTFKKTTGGFFKELLGYGALAMRFSPGERPDVELARRAALEKSIVDFAVQQAAEKKAMLAMEAEREATIKRIRSLEDDVTYNAMKRAGYGAAEIAALRAGGNPMEVERAQAVDAQARMFAETDRRIAEQTSIADKISGLGAGVTDSPLARFREGLELLNKGFEQGAIGQGQYGDIAAGLRKKAVAEMAAGIKQPDMNWGGKVEGSAAAYEAIVRQEMGSAQDAQVAAMEEQAKQLEEQIRLQRTIADNTARSNTVVEL